MKIGQPIRTFDEVRQLATLHGDKAGTPTMGGVLILVATLVTTLLFAEWNRVIFVCLGSMVALGGLGFWDDFQKVKYHNSKGVSARCKLVFQCVVGIVGTALLMYLPDSSGSNYSSFVSEVGFPMLGSIDFGFWALPFGALVLVSASNAVNLTDGLDGLASGCTVTTGGAYAVIALLLGCPVFAGLLPGFVHHPMVADLAILLAALVGSCLGFMWYNCYPAKVFMGDTGSLAIGGALGMAAICTAQELLFIVIGGVFVMEALSVVLQVASFKSTGKRIFAMAPIHHHFELKGWKETQVIVRFWMISLLLALLGLTLLILD
jgi:phospho-N-acetylmuramoyl-pentapeptide-transferase